ncbi:MAG TPA: SH3 domain-containing protein [Burkholderiaceae bacterium]
MAFLLTSLTLAPAPARADPPPERLLVTDPYIELRTGPGRGYPIFFVAGRGEWVEIELRHTDWFKVRTAAGKEGWVDRRQLENTLTEAGSRKTFREIVLDDYLRRRGEFGAAWGQFRSEPMLKVWAGYSLNGVWALEATAGEVQGTFSGTDFWHVNLLAQPWSDRRLEPFFGIGFGEMTNIPQATLVSNARTNAKLADATIGLRYHFGERFIARLEYTAYTGFVSDSRTDEYKAITAGISFFF